MRDVLRAHGQIRCALAISLLTASTLAMAPTLALAQTGAPTAPAGANFAIAAQPLPDAITLFTRQSGVQVTADAGLMTGRTSGAVSGSLAPAAALSQLLAGTGLTFRFVSPQAVRLEPAPQAAGGAIALGPVRVEGQISDGATSALPPQEAIRALPPAYASGVVARGQRQGMLGNQDMMDTPYTATSYTTQAVQNTPSAVTVMDLLSTLSPSARNQWNNAGSSASQINLRGFSVGSGDIGYGGLYGVLPTWSVAPELAERVELLEGPTAMLNGMPPGGSVGGAVNLVPKRATDTPITQVTASFAGKSQLGGHVDLGRRFGDEGQFGVRFNGVYRDGNTAIDHNRDRTALAALGLDYRSDAVRLSADLGYQDRVIRGISPYLVLNPGQDIPAPPRASLNSGQPWSRFSSQDWFGALRGEVDLSDHITLHAAAGGDRWKQHDLEDGNHTLTDAAGDVTVNQWNIPGQQHTWSVAAGASGWVDTGPVHHALSLDGTALGTTFWGWMGNMGPDLTSNIYAPSFYPAPDLPEAPPVKQYTTRLYSLALADKLSVLDGKAQLTLGGRLQRVVAINYDSDTGAVSSSYDRSTFSPSVGLLVKPWKPVSLYVNYIQGLRQGTAVTQPYANAGTVFPPYKTSQYEAGIKLDLGRFATTLSLYQLAQPSLIVDSASNTMKLIGKQRNRGLELNIFGEPVKGLRATGGVSLIDPVLTHTQDGLDDGKTASMTPGVQSNVALEWDVPRLKGLTLTGRFIYTGWQYFDIDTGYDRRIVPSWTRVDLGARYVLERVLAHPVTLRLDVQNVANRSYWASGCCSSYIMEGLPRNLSLSASFNF